MIRQRHYFLLLQLVSTHVGYNTRLLVESASAYVTGKGYPFKSTRSFGGGRYGRYTASILAAASRSDVPISNFPIQLPDSLLQHDKESVEVAVQAVVRACHVSNNLQPDDSNGGISTVTKTDYSPVTVADYAVQAIVLQHLHQHFPDDEFIAEEDSNEIEQDGNLASQISQATGISNLTELFYSVNLGQGCGNERKRRVWCLDPIDGTRGFLRGKLQGGQFCVALALLEDGVPTLGILGCPNLSRSLDDADENEDNQANNPKGCLFVAVKGAGCYQLPLSQQSNPGRLFQKLAVTPADASSRTISHARMCLGVEKYSDARGLSAGMARYLYQNLEGNTDLRDEFEIPRARRVDSQVKYGLLARGDGEFYVRLPRVGYQEWIWDHAAGSVVLEEAGGMLTDTEGNPINFGLGRQLSASVRGILGSNGGSFHQALLNAYRRAEDDLQSEENRD